MDVNLPVEAESEESKGERLPIKYQSVVLRKTYFYVLALFGAVLPAGITIFSGIMTYNNASQAAVNQVDQRLQEFRLESARTYVPKDDFDKLNSTVNGIDGKVNQILGFMRAKYGTRPTKDDQ